MKREIVIVSLILLHGCGSGSSGGRTESSSRDVETAEVVEYKMECGQIDGSVLPSNLDDFLPLGTYVSGSVFFENDDIKFSIDFYPFENGCDGDPLFAIDDSGILEQQKEGITEQGYKVTEYLVVDGEIITGIAFGFVGDAMYFAFDPVISGTEYYMFVGDPFYRQ